jgi:phosphotransferase system IIB component
MYQKAMEVIKAYGHPENIVNIDACITKLRIQVKDKTPINSARLMELGALGVTHPSSQSVYAVFGSEADVIKNVMKEIIAKGEYKRDEEIKITVEQKEQIFDENNKPETKVTVTEIDSKPDANNEMETKVKVTEVETFENAEHKPETKVTVTEKDYTINEKTLLQEEKETITEIDYKDKHKKA